MAPIIPKRSCSCPYCNNHLEILVPVHGYTSAIFCDYCRGKVPIETFN